MKAIKSNGIECMIITLCFFCAAVIGGCDGDDSTSPAAQAQIARDIVFTVSGPFGVADTQDPDAPGLPITGSFNSGNDVDDFYTDKDVFDAPVVGLRLVIDGYTHTDSEVRVRFTYEDDILARIYLYNVANGIDVGPGPDFKATFVATEFEPLEIFEYSTADAGPWIAQFPDNEIASDLIFHSTQPTQPSASAISGIPSHRSTPQVEAISWQGEELEARGDGDAQGNPPCPPPRRRHTGRTDLRIFDPARQRVQPG